MIAQFVMIDNNDILSACRTLITIRIENNAKNNLPGLVVMAVVDVHVGY